MTRGHGRRFLRPRGRPTTTTSAVRDRAGPALDRRTVYVGLYHLAWEVDTLPSSSACPACSRPGALVEPATTAPPRASTPGTPPASLRGGLDRPATGHHRPEVRSPVRPGRRYGRHPSRPRPCRARRSGSSSAPARVDRSPRARPRRLHRGGRGRGADEIADKQAEAEAVAGRLADQARAIVALDKEHRAAQETAGPGRDALVQAETELAGGVPRQDEARRLLVAHAQAAYVTGGSMSIVGNLATGAPHRRRRPPHLPAPGHGRGPPSGRTHAGGPGGPRGAPGRARRRPPAGCRPGRHRGRRPGRAPARHGRPAGPGRPGSRASWPRWWRPSRPGWRRPPARPRPSG